MTTTEFRLDLGAAWLALLSTVGGRFRDRQADALDTPAQLGRFLDAVGLAPRRRPGQDDLDVAHELREGLYAMARAEVSGGAAPRAALRAVNAALAWDAAPAVSLGPDGLRAGRPADARAALGRIARQAVEQLTGVDQVRLRACGDDTCSSIFVDESGRRRWCNDKLCGSRIRVQAHRARARATHDHPGSARN